MNKLKKTVLMVMLLAVFGCGNSFYEAQDYLTGPVSGVGLKKSTTIASGGTEQLSAVVVPSKTSNKGVTWTSSDSSIVSVDANGLVSAVVVVAHGQTKQAVITVTTSEGGYSTQCTVTVVEKPVAVTGVTLNRSSAYLYYQSGSIYSTDQLAATITPSAATNQAITWSSDDPTIASVNNGLVTPNRTGSTVIRVTTADGGYSASCTYTVTASPVLVTGISLNKSALTLAAGYSETLFASIVPTTATNQTLTWTSSTSAATVDALGNVTGVSAGSSTIRATTTDGSAKYAEATVTVVSTPVSVTGVTVSPKTATVAMGSQQTLTATITPSGATNQNLEWNSNNSGIVSVSSSGIITGIAAGNAKVTVTTIDGSYTATSYITVSSEPAYAVTYYPNNPATGTTSGSVPADANGYMSGATVTVRNNGTIVNTLNTFTGWNTQAGGGGTTYSPGSTFTMGSADVSLYAQWTTAATYTVTYDGNFNTGGSVPADGNTYTSGTAVTVLGNVNSLVRTGFVFGGWYMSSGTILTAGSGTFTMPAYNVTLMAYWIPVHTVTYIGNGNTSGSVPVDSVSYTEGVDTVTISANTGSLAGEIITGSVATNNQICQRFTGWNTSPDGNGTSYSAGSTLTMGKANMILYAVYTTDTAVIGKVGPGGGWVFYDAGSTQTDAYGSWRYMECAVSNVAGFGSVAYPPFEWSTIANAYANGSTPLPATLGTGRANTYTIVAQNSSADSAAKLCQDYRGGGLSDWFLPSLDEFNAIAAATSTSGLGSLSWDHWTSSEISETVAYVVWVSFDTDHKTYSTKFDYIKSSLRGVRPVRAF